MRTDLNTATQMRHLQRTDVGFSQIVLRHKNCLFTIQQKSERSLLMKNAIYALLVAGALTQAGCSPEFWGGTALGALGAGGGYEYNNKRQMDKLEDDY
jgi:hypothetical protein